jgi:hypothetical protein
VLGAVTELSADLWVLGVLRHKMSSNHFHCVIEDVLVNGKNSFGAALTKEEAKVKR